MAKKYMFQQYCIFEADSWADAEKKMLTGAVANVTLHTTMSEVMSLTYYFKFKDKYGNLHGKYNPKSNRIESTQIFEKSGGDWTPKQIVSYMNNSLGFNKNRKFKRIAHRDIQWDKYNIIHFIHNGVPYYMAEIKSDGGWLA